MLILTRRIGESVVINEDIYCTILGYNHEIVRLAFDAPESIPIHRDEIQRRIYHELQKDNWLYEQNAAKGNIVERLISKFQVNEQAALNHR